MRKRGLFVLLLLFTSFAAALPTVTVFAQSAESAQVVDPNTLLDIADTEIFTKPGYQVTLSPDVRLENEILDREIIFQHYVQSGMVYNRLISIHGAPQLYSVTMPVLQFGNYRGKDFHAISHLRRNTADPENGGYCWLKYDNAFMAGAGKDSGLLIYPGWKVSLYHQTPDGLTEKEIADLSDYTDSTDVQIDVIRLDGITYLYLNQDFIAEFQDEIQEQVSFSNGTLLREGGHTVECLFTDFYYVLK